MIQIGTTTSTLFGEGVRLELPRIVSGNDDTHVLIIASESALQRPLLLELVELLESFSKVDIWCRVRPNPRVTDIDECINHYKAKKFLFTHVVGIGGGSVLDQAKATAAAMSCDSNVAALLATASLLPTRSNKLILLPTTSGTGAELSYGAILTDEINGTKLGLRGSALAADHALVDPELTWSTPIDVSMITGFDVLTHALETWLSKASTSYTQDLSRAAIERVFRWLPALYSDPEDKLARREISYASMLMGINLALSTTCLPHRLQYPIGAATDTAHAAGLAAIYPVWLNYVLPHATDKLAECTTWITPFHKKNIVTTTAGAAEYFVEAVKELLEQIDLTITLQDLGVTLEMLSEFPSQVNGKLETDPCYNSKDDIANIYHEAFDAGIS